MMGIPGRQFVWISRDIATDWANRATMAWYNLVIRTCPRIPRKVQCHPNLIMTFCPQWGLY